VNIERARLYNKCRGSVIDFEVFLRSCAVTTGSHFIAEDTSRTWVKSGAYRDPEDFTHSHLPAALMIHKIAMLVSSLDERQLLTYNCKRSTSRVVLPRAVKLPGHKHGKARGKIARLNTHAADQATRDISPESPLGAMICIPADADAEAERLAEAMAWARLSRRKPSPRK
jgi:hypothetical protein